MALLRWAPIPSPSMSVSFITELPDRPESILKGVAYGYNEGNPVVCSACSSMEAPSAIHSARMVVPDLEVSFCEIPDPDPRVPFETVKVLAWKYRDQRAEPNLPVPPAEVVEAVRSVITTEFSLDAWGTAAERLARRFASLTPCEVLGVMVFPPACPGDIWPWDWMFRAQVLTALVLARHSAGSWLASAHASHLLDLLYGPVDWTTTAALVALTDRAREDAFSRAEIVARMTRLLTRPMSPIWYMCAYKPACQLMQHIPGLDEKTRNAVRVAIDQLEAEESDA